MNRSVNSVAMAASLLISVSLATGTNAEVYTPQLGGSGGAHFEDNCKTDDYLIGLDYSAGKALNQVTPVCTAQKNGKWIGGEYKRHLVGGERAVDQVGFYTLVGANGSPRCQHNQFVTALHVWWDKYGIVHHIKVFCHNVSRDSESTFTTDNLGGEPSHDGSSPCPKGFFAVGLVGHYGALIDRIGLKCLSL